MNDSAEQKLVDPQSLEETLQLQKAEIITRVQEMLAQASQREDQMRAEHVAFVTGAIEAHNTAITAMLERQGAALTEIIVANKVDIRIQAAFAALSGFASRDDMNAAQDVARALSIGDLFVNALA
jgi:hypothetical protein